MVRCPVRSAGESYRRAIDLMMTPRRAGRTLPAGADFVGEQVPIYLRVTLELTCPTWSAITATSTRAAPT